MYKSNGSRVAQLVEPKRPFRWTVVGGSNPPTATSVKTITLVFIFSYNFKVDNQAPRERRLFFIEIYKPLKYTIMKQNKRDFLEAIGFDGNERDMVKQMLFGIGVGMAFIFMLGLAEAIGDWIAR